MLTKRVIPCLDVRNGVVVKGVKFKNHIELGGILELAQKYRDAGADELVFYDITASVENRTVATSWVEETAKRLDIPFSVAGGIRSLEDARAVLYAGADKVSINTPALNNPKLIDELAKEFGSQCVVIGVDSQTRGDEYFCRKYTGSEKTITDSGKKTLEWVKEVQDRGAGEIVLNCIDRDGVRAGYDVRQTAAVRDICKIPLIASGGAGAVEHFEQVFQEACADGALAAGVFHKGELTVPELKRELAKRGIEVRL